MSSVPQKILRDTDDEEDDAQTEAEQAATLDLFFVFRFFATGESNCFGPGRSEAGAPALGLSDCRSICRSGAARTPGNEA